jgi:hypothetical protein
VVAVNVLLAQCLVKKMDDRYVKQRINIKFLLTLGKYVKVIYCKGAMSRTEVVVWAK